MAGIVLAVDRREVYVIALLANASTYLVTAGLVRFGMPEVERLTSATGPSALTALKDRPFLAFVALDGVLSMHDAMAQIAIPLWVATATDAPRWLISVLMVLNSVAVILLQIRVARGTENLPGAARAGRRAGLLLAAACAVLALTDVTSGAITIGLLIVAALVHVIGEMLQSAGGWGISFELAPPGAQGQYQGAYAMGHQVGDLIAPLILTTIAVTWGWPGWLLTAIIFLTAGTLIPIAVHRTPPPGRRIQAASGLEEVAEVAGGGEAGSVGADGAGGRAVADEVDAGVAGLCGAVHADAAGGLAQVQRREVGEVGAEAGGPQDRVDVHGPAVGPFDAVGRDAGEHRQPGVDPALQAACSCSRRCRPVTLTTLRGGSPPAPAPRPSRRPRRPCSGSNSSPVRHSGGRRVTHVVDATSEISASNCTADAPPPTTSTCCPANSAAPR